MLPRPVAGAVSSVLATLVFYPLDVRKAQTHAQHNVRMTYRGLGWDTCGSFASTLTYFHTYERLLHCGTIIAPASAVAVSSLIASPVGTIVRRRQIRDTRPVPLRTHLCVYGVSVLRNVPKAIVKYSVYEAVRASFLTGPHALQGLIAGLLSSAVSVLLFSPLDYLKTCISLQTTPRWNRLFCGARIALLHSVTSNAFGHALMEHLSPRDPLHHCRT